VFQWQVRRTTGSLVTVDLTFFDGTSSRVELTFSNGLLGAYQMRDQNTAGIAQVTEGGGFSLHTGRIRDESHEAVLPTTLAGQSVLFEEGGTVSRYDFGTAGLVNLASHRAPCRRPERSTCPPRPSWPIPLPGHPSP
jgi:hypothetical protein